ncbi:hypothetical protein CUJ84_Chr002515 [Rhizobium leguminosarum]|uniref:Uncharacterized protein n=1 Tax=Rhizobium leguminosarum TaxID=384 RepID=A0A2K9Z3W0_RHILE|nr:hypothetical protein CUJ84_Chr002515 [Rhizobium leguminosarum]
MTEILRGAAQQFTQNYEIIS